MKSLILTLFLLTATAYANPTLPEPKCVKPVDSRDVGLRYFGMNHFWADFCINKLKTSPQGCIQYQRTTSQEQQAKDVEAFLKAKAKKLCGKK